MLRESGIESDSGRGDYIHHERDFQSLCVVMLSIVEAELAT